MLALYIKPQIFCRKIIRLTVVVYRDLFSFFDRPDCSVYHVSTTKILFPISIGVKGVIDERTVAKHDRSTPRAAPRIDVVIKNGLFTKLAFVRTKREDGTAFDDFTFVKVFRSKDTQTLAWDPPEFDMEFHG